MAGTRLSRGDVLLLAAVLSIAGVADAAYLTWMWYAEAGASWCDINAYVSCSAVGHSVFASVAGVPTAVVGLIGFGLLGALVFLMLRGRERVLGRRIEAALLGLAVLGALIGAGLSVVEVFAIHAVCILCAIGFALDLGVLALAAGLVRATPRD
jgi:uncharacterized membrane protein